jgi:hypothetical protein
VDWIKVPENNVTLRAAVQLIMNLCVTVPLELGSLFPAQCPAHIMRRLVLDARYSDAPNYEIVLMPIAVLEIKLLTEMR